MGYFAEVSDTGTVLQVISISNHVLDEPALSFPETEPVGQAFIADVLRLPGSWKQCSYNSRFRGAYPGPGWRYDLALDQFLPPEPDPS